MSIQKAIAAGLAVLLVIGLVAKMNTKLGGDAGERVLSSLKGRFLDSDAQSEVIYQTDFAHENKYVIRTDRVIDPRGVEVPLDSRDAQSVDAFLRMKGLSLKKIDTVHLRKFTDNEEGVEVFTPETKGPPYYLVVSYL